jgi:hypothetical protein
MGRMVSNGAHAATSRSPTPSSHTRPTVRTAWPAETAGWSCGSAFPAAGWPALTIHRISTPKPTTKRPTTLSPFRSGTANACAGATSINARSDVGSVEPVQSDYPASTNIQAPHEVVSAHHAPLVWWSDVRTRGTDLDTSIPTSTVQTTAHSAVVAMADVGNGFTGTGMGELFAFNLDRRVFNRIDAPSGTSIRDLRLSTGRH